MEIHAGHVPSMRAIGTASAATGAFSSAARLRAMSDTNRNDLTRFDRTQRAEDLWNKRAKFLDTVRSRRHYDNSDARRAQVLLKRQVLIDGEKHLEAIGDHEPQELAVAFGRPSHVRDMVRVVRNKLA